MNNPNDYRVGDRVVIAPETYLKQKGIDVSYEIYVAGTDRIVELEVFLDDKWLVKRETGKISIDYFFLPEAAILGHSFEWGEEIEVRDYDSHNWKREKFSGYAIGHSCPVKVGGSEVSYCYARPIRKKEKKEIPPRFKNGTWVVNPSHLKPYEVVDRSLYPYANKIDIDGWWACRGYGRDNVGYDFSSEYIEIPAPPTEEQLRKLGYRVTGNIVDANIKGNTVFDRDGGWVYKSSMAIGGIVYRWEAEKIEPVEPVEPAEPEIFWGKLDGIYYSTPNGNYEPEDIAKHYQAKYPDWEFLGFYEENRDFSGIACGNWHAEKKYPGGIIKLLPWVKFRRKA